METLIVHPENSEKLEALKAFLKALKIKFEAKKEDAERRPKPYNQAFVAEVLEGREDRKNGKTTKITLDEVWK